MKIAVWKTGHEIADRVAISLARGLNADLLDIRCNNEEMASKYDAHAAYGILRGTESIFNSVNHWFNVDRGYFNPRHFDGYYRISYRGTQLKWTPDLPRKPMDIKFERWRKPDPLKRILICPPTYHVRKFFGYTGMDFQSSYEDKSYVVRLKGDTSPLNLDDYNAVITFNSSIGWQALQKGIPVLSNANYSAIGSFYNCSDLKTLTDKLHNIPDNRIELFEAMNASQFTLAEIEQGKAWPLMEHLIYSSDSTAEKLSAHMSPPIPFSNEPALSLKYII